MHNEVCYVIRVYHLSLYILYTLINKKLIISSVKSHCNVRKTCASDKILDLHADRVLLERHFKLYFESTV